MSTITKPIPNHIFINGVNVKYEGSQPRPKTCRNTGHVASECPDKYGAQSVTGVESLSGVVHDDVYWGVPSV